jgi:hypothetical protein
LHDSSNESNDTLYSVEQLEAAEARLHVFEEKAPAGIAMKCVAVMQVLS